MYFNLRKIDGVVTKIDPNLRTINWNFTTIERDLSFWIVQLSTDDWWLTLDHRIRFVLYIIQHIYYPILAIVGVPVNLLTAAVLIRRNCGLSDCVTRYLVSMAAADLLVIIFDLILRHIPIVYVEYFNFLWAMHVCNIHAVLLYAATDCSVWFTISFTIDRFVAICCQKLRSKYCTEKTATVVLGSVTVLSFLKNIFWYFMLSDWYLLRNNPWFCGITFEVEISAVWVVFEFLHHSLTPCVPFVLILLLDVLTIRHILMSSRARRRLRAHSSGERPRDPEMESRRKSIILLFVISANFILLWAMLMVYSIWRRIYYMVSYSVWMGDYVRELGFMLQLLSCCTNTGIYAVTQTKFREQLKNVLKYPFTLILRCFRGFEELNH